jgi:hypothetical protein
LKMLVDNSEGKNKAGYFVCLKYSSRISRIRLKYGI